MTWRLVVDVRKAFDAGIGTYIRNVVPRVLDRLGSELRVAALVPHDQLDRYDWLPARNLEILATRAAPLGLAEQIEFRRVLDAGTLFWATSLAHPLLSGGPTVATVHDVAQLALSGSDGMSWPVSLVARLLLASLRQRAVALMAVSDFTRREFVDHVGQPACGRIDVTPLGVDAVWFDAAPPQRDAGAARRFVCVGSVRPHKNIARLLQAFAIAAHRVPHELVVAGMAAKHNAQEPWLAALPAALRQRVRFTGQLPDAELRSLVAGADALVLPSLYEGFGLPALEAMAAGCPVLASNAGALPEVCAGAAAYFDPRSVEQIGQALLGHAARSAGERQAIAERGIAHARTFTWERTADLTASAIESALRATSKPA